MFRQICSHQSHPNSIAQVQASLVCRSRHTSLKFHQRNSLTIITSHPDAMTNESIAWCLEDLVAANDQIKVAQDKVEKEYNELLEKLCLEERALADRLSDLNKKMDDVARVLGNINASGDDILEINAGGKIIVTERSILTHYTNGTMLNALFSGRYDKFLQRDGSGRIFLDVNPKCFQSILTYLNEMVMLSEGNPPEPPCADDEYVHILCAQLELFGLWGKVIEAHAPPLPNSIIIPSEGVSTKLFVNWLKENESSAYFGLRYRGTLKGFNSDSFSKRCAKKGLFILIMQTEEHISDCSRNRTRVAKFLSGQLEERCRKLLDKLPSRLEENDLSEYMLLSDAGVYTGRCSSTNTCTVAQVEIFEIFEPPKTTNITTSTINSHKRVPIQIFHTDINKAINKKQDCLPQTELKVRTLEDSFREEHAFIDTFASGDVDDVITLNVRGTLITTKRSTLRAIPDSVLSQQFDEHKWTEQGYIRLRVKRWTVDDVCAWVNKIDGMQEDIGTIFKTNGITGCELLALSIDGLRMLGIERAGTVCLLQKEIDQLVKASDDVVSLIDHCPYCFGKIIDYLRLKQLHAQGLAKDEPALPDVPKARRARFEKVVNYYFPGDAAKLILGA